MPKEELETSHSATIPTENEWIARALYAEKLLDDMLYEEENGAFTEHVTLQNGTSINVCSICGDHGDANNHNALWHSGSCVVGKTMVYLYAIGARGIRPRYRRGWAKVN